MKKIPPAILKRAKKIKLLAMDVDGVLTGGELIILNSGEEMKIWSVKDRMGFAMLKAVDTHIKLAWITARQSEQVAKRAEELGVHFVYQKSQDKWKQLEVCGKDLGLKPEEIAFIGDDLVDWKCLRNVGLAVCPPESHDLLKETVHYQTETPAGKGVVREVIEILLKAQDKWAKVIERFVFVLVFLGLLGLVACSSPMPLQDHSEKPDQWIETFTITETLSGMPMWVLNSESAQIFNKKKKATLDNIRIQFMNMDAVRKNRSSQSLMLAKKSQTQRARLSAPKGEVKLDTHDLAVWGGVEIESEGGVKLYTERLIYSTEKQRILTESPVKIVKKDSILMGEGLEATPDLETVKIYRHQASIYPKNLDLK